MSEPDRLGEILSKIAESDKAAKDRHEELRLHLFGDGDRRRGIYLRLDRAEQLIKLAGAAIGILAGSLITAIVSGWRNGN